jgi:tellurite resistance protein
MPDQTSRLDHGEEELLDAVVTAAALLARADGWIDPIEYAQLFDFLDRSEFLSIFTRADIRDAFERRIRELREPGGPMVALARLRRHGGCRLARLVVDVGEEIAAADCRLDPREQYILQLIKITLWPQPSPADQRVIVWKRWE